MTLPASFVQHIEQHPCFTGCFNSASGAQVCLDPNRPLAPLVIVSCQDCYAHFALPASLLPANFNANNLAPHLTQHVQTKRGFALSVSGYFTKGSGFWFSAVYYACGVFLINGERSRALGTDLEQLINSFRQGILAPPDPRMLDPRHFAIETVHVNFATASSGARSKQALLSSPQVRLQAATGWKKVTLAEFLPLSGNGASAAASAAARPTLKVGDICPVCRAEVRVRQLLQSTYVGCLC